MFSWGDILREMKMAEIPLDLILILEATPTDIVVSHQYHLQKIQKKSTFTTVSSHREMIRNVAS